MCGLLPFGVGPLVAISLGDPLGVGPEVIVKALADGAVRERGRWVVLGPAAALRGAARAVGVDPYWSEISAAGLSGRQRVPSLAGDVVCVEVEPVHANGRPVRGLSTLDEIGAWFEDCAKRPRGATRESGAISKAAVEQAIALAKRPSSDPWRVAAVCTGPISKRAWMLAGFEKYPGHTELFAARFGVEKFAMMFHAPAREGRGSRERGTGGSWGAAATRASGATADREGPGLNVILATVHQPLRTVARDLTKQRISDCIELGAAQLRRLGVASPRIAVAGLNPHAGEQGMLGTEDDTIIAPAIEMARALPALAGCEVSGPYPADTVFQRALAWPNQPPEQFDLVVAMYHDQGLIPLKTLAWDRAVNMTVGLPILRTSPDHGTAFDIAGRGVADEGSMKAALGLAAASAR